MPVPPPRRIQRERCPILRFQGVLDCCMGTGKTRGTGRNAHWNRRQDSNLRFPEGCSYPDSSDIGVRSGLCRYCGSQRGLLKTHAALPEFRLNDFDGIHSLMDGLLCVPLKETNPPPESDSEISKGLRPLLVCLHQTPQRI